MNAAEHLAKNPKKNCRYRVTEVWGSMVGRVEVGGELIDYDRGEETQWEIFDHKRGEIAGGMCGDFIGFLTDDSAPAQTGGEQE